MIFWAAAAIGALSGLVYLLKIAPAGCGYKAKVLCSALFVAGRKLEDALDADLSRDSYRILRLFGAEVDREARSVTASFLGLRSRTAVYRDGFGAALGGGPPPAALALPAVRPRDWTRGEKNARLGRAVESFFTEPDPKRLRRTRAVAVAVDGKLVCERYAPGFTPEMPLPGWSMTKSVLAALAGILIRDGKLFLKQDGLLPEWRSAGDLRGKITLDDLLRMRSGLVFAEVYGDPLSDVTQMLFNSPGAVQVAAGKPLAHPPGTKWCYSSGTTNILSRVIREALADDARYWSLPRRELFGPLGMSSAVFEIDAAGDFVGSSFLHASARDWARFGELFRLDGVWEGRRVLPEGWAAYSTTPTPQSPGGRYGAHWWLKLQREFGGESEHAAHIPDDAYFALGHEGQTLTVAPSRGLVAVRLGMSIYIDAWNQAEFIARVLEAL